ncbi:MAG: hypothetical protein ACHQWU_12950 [Gemmatimonadales bacterium]
MVLCAVAAVFATPVGGQVSPNLDWRTIRTAHFYIDFAPTLEPLARRMAADAERAYGELSEQLHPPRGMIDVVLSDDVDFSNGSATPYPTNRIVVYANPPISESALRYTSDWGQMVITHELTHIFHLDRTRGIWALGQHIFGRPALLFPNLYSPSWLTEGLAVYEESRLTGAGRVLGSEHRMIARAAAIDHAFPPIGALSLAQSRYPFGESAYAYGSLFIDYLARTRGDSAVRRFVDKSSAELIPYLIDIPARAGFGVSFSQAWREFSDSVTRSVSLAPPPPLPAWRQLTNDGVFVFAPRWMSDSSIVYSGAPGRESFGAFRVDLNGRRRRVGRRNGQSPNVPRGDGSLVYAQPDFVNPYQQRSDLWVQRGGKEHQITFGQRLTDPDVRADGAIVAQQITPGATRIVLVSRDGKRVTPITTGSYDEQWTEPRWSHSGTLIAASRWLRGNVSQIVVLDTTGRIVHTVSSGVSIEATPSWVAGDAGVLYSSDRTGSTEIYVERFDDTRGFANAATYRLSSAETGLFEPTSAPGSGRAAAVLFRADGYHLGVGACCATNEGAVRVDDYRDTVPRVPPGPVLVDSGRVTKYNPWRTFLPHYWLPAMDPGIDGGYRIGAMTSGIDVVGRHIMSATVEFPTNNTGVVGSLQYQYAGLGLPVIQADASQDWQTLGGAFSRDASRTFLGAIRRRTLDAELRGTWLRQKYRSVLSLTAGTGVEHRSSAPAAVVAQVDSNGALGTHVYPTLLAAAGFANYQRPPFSISPEDGVQLNVTVRDRLRSGATGTGGPSYSTVGQASLYKSLDLPGFAHHVIALRGSAGYADTRASGYFTVGGINGTPFQIIPDYVIGEGANTFPVRGFPAGTLVGTRAATGSAEYRIPLFLTGRAPGALPFFLDRSSLSLFGDWGTAWCPDIAAGREVCNANVAVLTNKFYLASAGAELNLNLGVLSWDSPYRFRVGVAAPVHDGALFGQRAVQVYLAAGASF